MPNNTENSKKKKYVKPNAKRMNNEFPAVVSAGPPVPGAATAASASPIAPGATVF